MIDTFRRHPAGVVPSTPGVGTNLKGDLAGGAWLHLLPDLGGNRVLLVGRLSRADVSALSRAGFELARIDDPADLAPRFPPLNGHPPRFDLIVVSRPLAGISPALTEVLAPGGALLAFDLDPRALRPPGFAVTSLVFRSEADRLRSVLVAGDRLTRYDFGTNGRFGGDGLLSRIRGRTPRHTTRGALFTATREEPVPRIVERLVEAGVSGPDPRWGLWARGDYNTQKLLMFTYPAGGYRPEVAVKITRSPDANARLANEYMALEILGELGHVDRGRAPRALFLSTAHGCCVCAETAVDGTRFEDLSRRARLDLLADAGHWLTDLGRSTARTVTGSVLADSLAPDAERFSAIFGNGPETDVLGRALDQLASCPAVPMVAQHGDAGAWNLIADNRGRAVFLDWESFRTTGPPLWDLLYLVRSVAARFHGHRRRKLREMAIDRHLLRGSRLTSHLGRAIDRQASALEIDPSLVEPLMLTAWMHRAVKEASRLEPDRIGSSRYLRLLRRTIAARGSRGHGIVTGREHPW